MTSAALSPKARTQLVVRGALAPLTLVVLVFGFAGRWDYWQGWVYLILNMVIVVLMGTLLTPDRSLVEERLNPKQGVKSWDKLYFALSTPLFFAAVAIGGLNARFGWLPSVPPAIYAAGLLVYLAGQALLLWARYTNRFFSSMVRIQTDRGQTVCSSGPYRYVRHPGYTGGILFELAMGIVLGSWWACVPQLIASLLLVWRTSMEDRTLQAELPGYTDFATHTRYRLLPGVW